MAYWVLKATKVIEKRTEVDIMIFLLITILVIRVFYYLFLGNIAVWLIFPGNYL